jgi:thiol-disulfide isomerase/thioredoxin
MALAPENLRKSRAIPALLGLLLAALASSAGAVGCQQKRDARCDQPQATAATDPPANDDERCRIERARKGGDVAAKAPGAPAAEPPRPTAPAGGAPEHIDGVPLKSLTAAQRALFWSAVADQFDPCGQARSFGETLLAPGAREACPAAWTLARFVVRRVKAGDEHGGIVLALLDRLRREHGKASFALEGRPRSAPVDAPVTVVEFYDYECPYCRELEPRLEALRKRHTAVAFVPKQCPVEYHAAAEPAARAVLAAAQQGKFWELHRALMTRPGTLDEAAIEAAAEAAGLDRERWRRDMESDTVRRLLAEDLADADRVEVPGTPTFFVNGVYVTFDELEDEIAEALARKPGAR